MSARFLIHRRQRGLTLIEVLIALVVLSIGVLGVAAMQMVSITNSHGSHHHSLATTYAYDAMDRLRAGESAADVTAHYQGDRFTSQFPNNFSLTVDNNQGQVTITVTWNDERLAADGESAQNQVVVRSRL